MGRSRAASRFRSLASDKELVHFVLKFPNLSHYSESKDSSLDALTIHQFLLVLLDLFLWNNFFSILHFLAIPCMILLEESISQFQFSIQTYLLSLSLVSQSARMKRMVSISLFPILRLNLRFSLIQFLAEPLSLPEWPSQLSVQGSFGGYLDPNACTKFNSRSLFPLDCELKNVVATDSRSNSATVSRWLELHDT